jgi:hypothetical protein
MMRSIKTLALAAVAAGALTAFIGAGTASASKLCSTTTDPCTSPWANGTTLDFSIASGGTATLKEPGVGGEVLDTCSSSTVKGTVTNGTATETVNGVVLLPNFTWGECTKATATTAGATFAIHKIAGTSNGTVTASVFKVTVLVFGFIDCNYELPEQPISAPSQRENRRYSMLKRQYSRPKSSAARQKQNGALHTRRQNRSPQH